MNLFFYTFDREVIIGSCTVVRNNTDRSFVAFTQLPLMVTSCKTQGQDHTTRILTRRDTEHFQHHKDPSHRPCIATPTSLSPPPL